MKIWNFLIQSALLVFALSLNPAFADGIEQPALNINNASIEQLEKIKGIGVKKAQAIVEYRLEHGNFTQVDELTKVKGIGSTFVEKNRAYLSVQ